MKVSNEYKVGALTIIGIVALILGFYYLKGQNLFGKTQKLYVLLEDANGIVAANPVSMHGKQIGKVSRVSFEKHGDYNVIFDLSLDKGIQIPQNTVVRIIELDLLGNKELRMAMPEQIDGYLQPNDTIIGEVKGNLFASVEEKISPLLETTTPMIANADSLIMNVNALMLRNQKSIDQSLVSLSNTLKNFEAISVKVNGIMASQQENIESIVANMQVLTETLAGNKDMIDSMLLNFTTISANLSSVELEPVINSAKTSLDEINKVLTALNNAEGSLGKLLYEDTLSKGLDSTLVSVNALINDLMANPKRYVSFSLIERKNKD